MTNPNPGRPFRDNAVSTKFGLPAEFAMVQPDDVDQTTAPYNHDSNDVSGYKGVSPEYRTYANVNDKPLASAKFTLENPEAEEQGVSESGLVAKKAPRNSSRKPSHATPSE